ncbi:MAG: hypothetical protein EOO05_14565, partial [Chitinophagaceae bacterium]
MDNRLPFWHFFIDIEKMLSYERWIDKYKLMLQAISNGHITFDDGWVQFRKFMKVLYLQEVRDEVMFDKLLDKAITREQAALEAYFKRTDIDKTKQATDTPVTPREKKPAAGPEADLNPAPTLVAQDTQGLS